MQRFSLLLLPLFALSFPSPAQDSPPKISQVQQEEAHSPQFESCMAFLDILEKMLVAAPEIQSSEDYRQRFADSCSQSPNARIRLLAVVQEMQYAAGQGNREEMQKALDRLMGMGADFPTAPIMAELFSCNDALANEPEEQDIRRAAILKAAAEAGTPWGKISYGADLLRGCGTEQDIEAGLLQQAQGIAALVADPFEENEESSLAKQAMVNVAYGCRSKRGAFLPLQVIAMELASAYTNSSNDTNADGVFISYALGKAWEDLTEEQMPEHLSHAFATYLSIPVAARTPAVQAAIASIVRKGCALHSQDTEAAEALEKEANYNPATDPITQYTGRCFQLSQICPASRMATAEEAAQLSLRVWKMHDNIQKMKKQAGEGSLLAAMGDHLLSCLNPIRMQMDIRLSDKEKEAIELERFHKTVSQLKERALATPELHWHLFRLYTDGISAGQTECDQAKALEHLELACSTHLPEALADAAALSINKSGVNQTGMDLLAQAANQYNAKALYLLYLIKKENNAFPSEEEAHKVLTAALAFQSEKALQDTIGNLHDGSVTRMLYLALLAVKDAGFAIPLDNALADYASKRPETRTAVLSIRLSLLHMAKWNACPEATDRILSLLGEEEVKGCYTPKALEELRACYARASALKADFERRRAASRQNEGKDDEDAFSGIMGNFKTLGLPYTLPSPLLPAPAAPSDALRYLINLTEIFRQSEGKDPSEFLATCKDVTPALVETSRHYAVRCDALIAPLCFQALAARGQNGELDIPQLEAQAETRPELWHGLLVLAEAFPELFAGQRENAISYYTEQAIAYDSDVAMNKKGLSCKDPAERQLWFSRALASNSLKPTCTDDFLKTVYRNIACTAEETGEPALPLRLGLLLLADNCLSEKGEKDPNESNYPYMLGKICQQIRKEDLPCKDFLALLSMSKASQKGNPGAMHELALISHEKDLGGKLFKATERMANFSGYNAETDYLHLFTDTPMPSFFTINSKRFFPTDPQEQAYACQQIALALQHSWEGDNDGLMGLIRATLINNARAIIIRQMLHTKSDEEKNAIELAYVQNVLKQMEEKAQTHPETYMQLYRVYKDGLSATQKERSFKKAAICLQKALEKGLPGALEEQAAGLLRQKGMTEEIHGMLLKSSIQGTGRAPFYLSEWIRKEGNQEEADELMNFSLGRQYKEAWEAQLSQATQGSARELITLTFLALIQINERERVPSHPNCILKLDEALAAWGGEYPETLPTVRAARIAWLSKGLDSMRYGAECLDALIPLIREIDDQKILLPEGREEELRDFFSQHRKAFLEDEANFNRRREKAAKAREKQSRN